MRLWDLKALRLWDFKARRLWDFKAGRQRDFETETEACYDGVTHMPRIRGRLERKTQICAREIAQENRRLNLLAKAMTLCSSGSAHHKSDPPNGPLGFRACVEGVIA